MKKKLLIALAVLLIIAVAGFAYLAANANALITKHKPDLERIASDAIGSTVTLGNLSVSVFPTTSVVIDRTEVKSSPGAKEGLTLQNVTLKLNPFALLRGTVAISTLLIDQPSLTLIKRANGIEIEGMPPKASSESGATTPHDASTASAAAPSSPLKVELSRFELRDGKITLVDTTAGNTRTSVERVNVTSAISLSGSKVTLPDLMASALVLGGKISATGKSLVFDMNSQDFSAAEIAVSLGRSLIAISTSYSLREKRGEIKVISPDSKVFPTELGAQFQQFLPKGMAFEGEIDPSFAGKIALNGPTPSILGNGQIAFDKVGAALPNGSVVTKVNGKVAITAQGAQQQLSTDKLSLLVNGEPIDLGFGSVVTPASFALNQAVIKGFGGTINAKADLDMSRANRFSTSIDAAQLAVQQLVNVLPEAQRPPLTGTIESTKVDLSGTLGDALTQSLTGKISFALKDGSLRGTNITAEVIKALSAIPLFGGSVRGSVPPENEGAVSSPDTAIKSLTAQLSIGNGVVQIENMQLSSTLFNLEGGGSATMAGGLDLTTTVYFEQKFSASLISKAKDFKNLTDAQGRVMIPLAIKGTASRPLVLPNVEKLLQTAAGKKLEEKATKALDRIFNKKGKGFF